MALRLPGPALRWLVVGIAASGVLLLILLWPSAPPAFAVVRSDYKPSAGYLLDRNGEVLDTRRLDFAVRRSAWTPLSDVSPALVAAVIDSEDRAFWRHGGVNWVSVLGALRDEYLRHRHRGASTITMQLATMLRPGIRPAERGWSGKLAQVRLARGLESRWTKAQILEAYLNLLQFRGEIQGIGSASAVLAGKDALALSMPEGYVLAALLPAPRAPAARVAQRACERSAHGAPALSCAQLARTAEQLLGRDASPVDEHLAPQLAGVLLKAPGARVQTTLDRGLQLSVRAALERQLAGLAAHNVRDGAAIVVDNASGEVLAYVGSAGANSHAAQVDGVRARRQAGSTLKPFLYELAFERGYLTPASLLDDSALNITTAGGLYLPRDYEHDFKGPVSVRTALGGSLNVPAVRTLVLLGVEPFRERLQTLGYSGLDQDADYYGYSLALGSAEVSLWEQAQAYRVLARGGLYTPLVVRAPAAPGTRGERRLLSATAAYLATDILSDRAARVVTFGLDNHLNTPYWSAAKTGTSKDMRDNWCIGFSATYTVGVWVGNFEGDPMHEVSGVTGAAPVWREVMDLLHPGGGPLAPAPPAGVAARRVEFAGGVEPARAEWFIDGSAPRGPIGVVNAAARAPRIANPTEGMVIAIDPDIPAERQRVPIIVDGGEPGLVVRVNERLVGNAQDSLLWSPRSGVQHLRLETAAGQVLDRVDFSVR